MAKDEIVFMIIVSIVSVYALIHGFRIVFLKKHDLEIAQNIYLWIFYSKKGKKKIEILRNKLYIHNQKIKAGYWYLFGGFVYLIWVGLNLFWLQK